MRLWRHAELTLAPTTVQALDAEVRAAGVAFITLTNAGYIHYTRNCLASLQRTQEPLPLTCHCTDIDSHAKLAAEGASAALVDASSFGYSVGGEFHGFKKAGLNVLMHLKLALVRRALLTHRFVVYTDGDIVYERPGVLAYCLTAMGDTVDLLTQNDELQDSMNDTEHCLCAGFMCVRATPRMLALLDVPPEVVRTDAAWDDQSYLRKVVRPQVVWRQLPLALFCNGRYFLQHAHDTTPPLRPLLTHFNWLKGDDAKRETMKRYGRWLLA